MTYKGQQKLHHKTKEWATRPDIKLRLNSCAPRVKNGQHDPN